MKGKERGKSAPGLASQIRGRACNMVQGKKRRIFHFRTECTTIQQVVMKFHLGLLGVWSPTSGTRSALRVSSVPRSKGRRPPGPR